MRRLLRLLILSLPLLGVPLLVAACGSDDESVSTESSTSTTAATAGRSALSVSLEVDEPIRSGAPVTWRVVVRNGLDAPTSVTFTSGKQADVVLTGGGRTWRWSDERMFTQALRDEDLRPGETVFELTTEALDLPPGTYEATPELATESAPSGESRTIQVVAG